MKKPNKLLLLLMAIAIMLAACSTDAGGAELPSKETPPAEITDPPEATESEPTEGMITVTDQAGREVTLAATAERLVSGYYISSSACIALGLTDKMVGIEAKADSRPIYRLAAASLIDLPGVGSAKEFDLEGCIALEPDLVILPKRLVEQANTMTELGIAVLLVSPESHRELTEMIELIGTLTGSEDRAEQLIDYYNSEYASIAALTMDISEKPTVYMGGNGAYLSTAPRDMYQASLINDAGGINAAANIDGSSWTEVSYEQLLAMNPDIIVVPSEASYSKVDIIGDEQLKDISAVINGSIYQMPKDFEAWDSPTPSCTLGIKWLLSVLHEDVYSAKTLQADAAEFYKTFYGIDIDTSVIGK